MKKLFGFFMLLLCLIATAFQCVAAAETTLVTAEGTTLPRKKPYQIKFDVPADKLADGNFVRFEFDARIDYPQLSGHNATAMTVFVNDVPIPSALMVNCPIEFRRANGFTGEAGRYRAARWNYDAKKTGVIYEDVLLKNGGDAYGLVYSPDFESIDSPKYAYRSPGFSRKHFVFDITSMLKAGENTITLYNPIEQEAVRLMGNKSDLALVIRDCKVYVSDVEIKKPQPFWLAELEALNNPDQWIAPIKDFSEKFTFDVDKRGMLSVTVGGKKYDIRTYFSYPNATKSSNGFPRPHTAQSQWQVKKSVNDNGTVTLEAAGTFYKVVRTITAKDNYIEVRDSITNTTSDIQGIIIRNQVYFEKGSVVTLSGLQVEPGQLAKTCFPENPTAFVENTDSSGIGIAPYDDVSRLHCQAFQIGETMELRDSQLALAPGKTVDLEWQIYPVNQGGYMRFLNNVRHNWLGVQPESPGAFHNTIVKAVAPTWRPKKGCNTANVFNTYKGGYLWGSAVEGNQGYEDEKLAIIASLRKAVPDIRVLGSYMAIYFSNGSDEDMVRFKDCMIVDRNGKPNPTEAGCRFFIPTRTNEFGKMVESTIDRMIDVWKVDGIYFDYMEGADAYYTYNQYDGVSGDVRESDGSLICTKGSYQLLSQDFLIYILKKIHSRGLFVLANRNNFTATAMRETNGIVPLRYTECGYPDQLARGQLGPTPMGLQRTFSNKLEVQVLRALYEGLTTSPYHTSYKHGEYDNPVSAMWPIAYREIHRGLIIGENKIVTAISGHFGFGDMSDLSVRFYDKDGRRVQREFPTAVKDGANYVAIKLEVGEIAVIDRVK